jgi:multisubunit Na+/H+ antiporter MnhB subunit
MTSSFILKNTIVSLVLASIIFAGASAAFAETKPVSKCTARAAISAEEARSITGNPTHAEVAAGADLDLTGNEGGENALLCSYSLIKFITNVAVVVIVAVSIALFFYAAFLYLTSEGGEQTKRARSIIVAGVVGLIIAFLAQNIPAIVRNFLGS